MKRLLVLVMAVAIVGTAFAETDPVFSGTFKAWYGYSINGETSKSVALDGKDTASPVDASDSMSLNLNAVIDDYNTVSVTFGLADAMYDKNEDSTTLATDTNRTAEYDQRADYVRMNTYTLTSDILGALGVTGPVGITAKFGKFAYAPVQVVSVAPLSTSTANGTDGTAEEVGIALDFKFIDMITLGVGVYPQQMVAKQPELGVNLKVEGIADMIDFAAYFVISKYNTVTKQIDGDNDDGNGDSVGASVAVSIGEMVKIGIGMEYNLEEYVIDEAASPSSSAFEEIKAVDSYKTENNLKLQLDTSLTLGKVILGISAGIDGLDTNFAEKFRLKSSIKVNLTDNFSIFGAIGLEDFRSDLTVKEHGKDNKLTSRFLYDVGLAAKLGNLGIQLGGSRKMAYMAPKDQFDNVIYVMFSSSF